ncbi:hypothetical protein KJ909_03725 [Patescibacteria group bacterium]|nr:hypothetical protein [Patescibacteria group bacterium]
MTKFQKYKLYLSTLIKYYFTQKTELSLIIVLSLIVFVWFSLIVHRIMANPIYGADRSGLVKLGGDGLGLLILFIKPIFLYIAGMIIIRKIKC